jgi:2-hydroxychromene-2-carboxylate isomerase
MATRQPTLTFWFEFASTYSYLAAMRIEALAAEAGVNLRWRPFLLGPIFQRQGWTTSPFNLYPAKGRNMWRDMERLCEAANLPLRRPDPFPQNSLTAARLATIGAGEPWGPAFVKAVYLAEFGEGRDIASLSVLGAILSELGLAADALISRARTDEAVKAQLKSTTEDAEARGLFGAPSFTTEGGELFWGNDRLEAALAWAKDHG